MEVLHSLLDLPLTASFLERFDREGAAAACALSSCASKDASCGAAARAAAAAAAACDRGCPFLTALRKYLLRNEAGESAEVGGTPRRNLITMNRPLCFVVEKAIHRVWTRRLVLGRWKGRGTKK